MNVIKRAFLACAVILLALVTPASACSDAEKKRIQVELDGIEALRKVGIAGISLNALRGVCVPVRSLEGSVKWIIEPVIKKAIELLKDQGIDLGDVDVHVSAVVKGKAAGVDNLAFVHLDQLALSQKRQGGATQIMVRMREGIDAEQAAEAIDAVFRTDEARTDTKSMQAFVAAAVGEIAEVVEFSRLLGYLAVLVVALVLANTVFISAQSRSGEMAVL